MSRRPLVALATLATLAALGMVGTALADDFTYDPPGQLVPGSGTGRVDENVYAPNMRFPMETGPAYANSQVWGHGGSSGPGGDQCDIENFSYPWHDNYCETRSWDMPLCPAGTGHQGQDTRTIDCVKNVHWVVAAEAGAVTSVGSYSVYITAADGTRYDYLHMGSVQVAVGDDVTKGQRIGKVSNEFGGTPTTVHLHFNLRQDVAGVGNVYVPPYLSMVTSYQTLMGLTLNPPEGSLDEASCESIRGWAASLDDTSVPIEARLYFDGEAGDGKTVGHPILADESRDDLCSALGSCDHAFEVGVPLSLLDGTEHSVKAYASDGSPDLAELGGSPKTFSCGFELPSGVRRKIKDIDAENAWRFSSFWDEISVSDGVIMSLPAGADLGDAPELLVSSSDPTALYVVDRGKKRRVPDDKTALAWDFDASLATPTDDGTLAQLADGPDMRPRPVVLLSATGDLWLVDDDDTPAPPNGVGSSGSSGSTDDGLTGDSGDGCSCAIPGTAPGRTDGSFLGVGLGLAAIGLARSRRGRRRA
ncbi:MAG TPA: M23 family metallopeptidase [Polyangiaceae bacterium]|nr:M23 family metallopeptidase [Polyangiaceae bacterium]